MSWTETTLGKSFEIYQPQTIATKDLNENGKYLVYGANGVIGRYDKFNHEKSQLLLTCRGATCGAINVSAPYSWINGNAMVIKSKINDINIRFIEYFFRGVVNLSKAITGSAQPQITRQSLSPIIFRYPPLPIQQKIVVKLNAIFSEIDKAVAAADANAKNVEALFQSQLGEIIAGEDDWSLYALREVCDIARGGSPRPIDKFITELEDGINWVKISDATRSKKYIYETRQKIKKEGISRSRFVNDGDFLLSNSMSFGRPYIMRTTGCIHDGWLVLSKYQKHLDIDFFYYLLSSSVIVGQFENLAKGSTVRNLNIELVSRVRIKIPSIQKQKMIVTKLNQISTEIDNLKKFYQKKEIQLKLLKQSILKKAFNGELVKAA